MKLHHKVIKHVNKHHKKYLFWAGVVFWITALKMLVIASVFLGIHLNIGRSEAWYQKTQMNETIQTIEQINILAHDFFDDRMKRWEIEDEYIINTFKQLDEWYENANNLNEKYRRAKKMEIFFDQMDEHLHAKNGIITPEDIQKDVEYHELKIKLDMIK